jgi:hypothetical protein
MVQFPFDFAIAAAEADGDPILWKRDAIRKAPNRILTA